MLFTPLRLLTNPALWPVLLFAAGGLAFRLAAPGCDRIPDKAYMFVLTGDARRIPFAIDKLAAHPNRRLYVIGAGTPTIDSPYGSQIEIENESKTTYENAIAIKRIAQRKLLTEITVITTEDHINRAAFLIKRQLPYVKINACAVPLTNMAGGRELERWFSEYIKFIGTVIGLESR